MDDGGHDQGSDYDEPIEITLTTNAGDVAAHPLQPLYRLRRFVGGKKQIEKQ